MEGGQVNRLPQILRCTLLYSWRRMNRLGHGYAMPNRKRYLISIEQREQGAHTLRRISSYFLNPRDRMSTAAVNAGQEIYSNAVSDQLLKHTLTRRDRNCRAG